MKKEKITSRKLFFWAKFIAGPNNKGKLEYCNDQKEPCFCQSCNVEAEIRKYAFQYAKEEEKQELKKEGKVV